MTPVSELRRLSFIGKVSVLKSSVIPRSQSDTTYNGLASLKSSRRGSDWSETMTMLQPEEEEVEREEVESEEESTVVLRPLKLATGDHTELDKSSLLYRRLSKGAVAPKSTLSASSTSSSSRDVSRSQSMKFVRKNTVTSEAKRRYRGSSIPSEVALKGAKIQQRTTSNRSLPLPGEESDFTRLRNFSVTSKGVVNRGDSFRSKLGSHCHAPIFPDIEKTEFTVTQAAGQQGTNPSIYRVLLVGAPDVGKTSLKNQFMTSEYICAYDGSRDESDSVIIVLNNEESQLEFVEETCWEDNELCQNIIGNPADAYIVVYSVTSRRSYQHARYLLNQIGTTVEQKAVILVGNKTDLARLRVVSTQEGRSLAKDRGCKFIETSVAINHQVDELLVGILTQIKMKLKAIEEQNIKKHKRNDSQTKKSKCAGSKASGVLKKILQRACLKSKSCDNLHVL